MAAPKPHVLQECKESANCTVLDAPPPTRGGFLTLRDSPTGYLYEATDGLLSVFNFESNLTSARPILKHDFGSGFAVMSAVYMRLNEKSDGVVVLTHETRTGSEDVSQLTYFSFQTRRVLKRCEVRGRFSVLEICIDRLQLEERASMKKRFQSMENILVIGGEDSLCYLVNMGPVSEDAPANEVPSPLARTVPLLQANDKGLLEYKQWKNQAITKDFLPSSARVTSLAYMHEQGLIAIGMSNGVLCSVSLRLGTYDLLMVEQGFKIERLCVQRPSDDPQNCMYLWAQLRNEATDVVLYLLRTVPQADASRAFSIRFRHRLPNCDRFLLMRTVVQDKDQAMTIGLLNKSDNEDSNASFAVREPDRFNQLMFFLYVESRDTRSRLRGSVFDMDTYYSSRMPGKAAAHEKSPDQCGFLSHFVADSEFSNCNLCDIMDALMVKIARFKPPASIHHVDQHLFPSALDFSVDVLAASSVIQLNVSSLQDRVIKDVSTNILKYYKRPGKIALFLHQIGLCNSVVQEDELMRVCLFRVLLHNFAGCEQFLEMEEVTKEQLQFFRKWLGMEVEQTKKRFDEECPLLVELPPEKVLRSTIDHVKHSQLVFRHTSRLYERLIIRFEQLNAEKDRQELVVEKKISEGLQLQASAFLFGYHMDFLRETPEQVERMNRLRLKFADRLMIVNRDEQTLEIRQIFEGVIAASKGVRVFDELFAHCSPAELYPPKSYIDLMAVLPHPGVTMTAKLQIMGYFAKDLDASTEKAVDRKYFKEACGYLLNDEMTDAAMSEMQAAWSSDQGLLREHCGCGRLGTDEQKRWRETEEKLNTQAARESNPRPTEQMARQSCEMHQKVPHGQAAQTLTDEPVSVEPVHSEDAELPNQPVRIRDRRPEAVVCKRCPICSIHLHGPNANGHPNAHKEDPKKSSFCAICGIIMQKSSGRNVHEQNQHGFIRHEADEKIKEVVRIRKSQLPRLFNVGIKLIDVQRTAVPSSDPQADEFVTDNELQEVVHADPQGDGCPDPKKNDVRKTTR